jgi:hypothetical protein
MGMLGLRLSIKECITIIGPLPDDIREMLTRFEYPPPENQIELIERTFDESKRRRSYEPARMTLINLWEVISKNGQW